MSQREKNHSNSIKKHNVLSQNSRYSFFQDSESDQEEHNNPSSKAQPKTKSKDPFQPERNKHLQSSKKDQHNQDLINKQSAVAGIQSIKKIRSSIKKGKKKVQFLNQDDDILSDDHHSSASFVPSDLNQLQKLKYSLLYFRCQNFKSHLGLSHKLRIKDPTAIIGLNGAGKSNLVDAIGFAFGMTPQSIRAASGFRNIMSNALLNLTQWHARKILQSFLKQSLDKSFQRKNAKICCYSNDIDYESDDILNDDGADKLMYQHLYNFSQITDPLIFFKIPNSQQQIESPLTFVQIEIEKRENQDGQDQHQNKFAYDEKLILRRQFEPVLKKDQIQKLLKMIKQSQNSNQLIDKNLASIDKFIRFKQRFFIFPSSSNPQTKYQIPKLDYIEFLRSQLNLQPEVKNFIIMQDDISPHKFTVDHHSQILQKISGAQQFKKQ